MGQPEDERLKKLIELFEAYLFDLQTACREQRNGGDDYDAAASRMNRRHFAMLSALRELGIQTVDKNGLELFDNLYTDEGDFIGWGRQKVVERALGYCEFLRDDPTMVEGIQNRHEASDVAGAIGRALRLSFRGELPVNERDVQDSVEVILRAVGVRFHREKERAVIGATTFIPDFTLPESSLALEIKLANEKHNEAAVQHEIAEDVAGFRRTWKRLLVIVYDCGVIHDPERMCAANEEAFGVQVLIVKR